MSTDCYGDALYSLLVVVLLRNWKRHSTRHVRRTVRVAIDGISSHQEDKRVAWRQCGKKKWAKKWNLEQNIRHLITPVWQTLACSNDTRLLVSLVFSFRHHHLLLIQNPCPLFRTEWLIGKQVERERERRLTCAFAGSRLSTTGKDNNPLIVPFSWLNIWHQIVQTHRNTHP